MAKKELTPEQRAEIRKRELAILKAENQMLEEAKKNVMSTDKLDDIAKTKTINDIETAMDDNRKQAKVYYGASENDLGNTSYREVSPYYIRKYQERLEKKGLTDEGLRNKQNTQATVSVKSSLTEKNRKHVKREKNEEFKQDLELETKLMNQTYIRNDNELSDNSEMKENVTETTVKQTRRRRKNTEDIVEMPAVEKIEEKKEEIVPQMEVDEEEIPENSPVNGYDFDYSTIPDYVQYDVIPLPSDGQCYPHKIGRLAVAYLTASDENLIASPNMYRDGKVIDVILDRKILDKRVRPNELCKGDRDAVILWLRATGYGSRFPITAMNQDTGKKYDIDFDLNQLKYLPFNLKGDKDGLFTYTTESGTKLKFKVLSYEEEEELKRDLVNERINISAFDAIEHLNNLQECFKNFNNFNDDDKQDADDCIADLKSIIGDNVKMDENFKHEYEEVITKQMIKYTVSVNGNTDRTYIENYINNMRAKEAYAYRTYVMNNKPGVDFNITVNIPESDGGGSFDTFLTTDDTIFLNI